MLFEIISKENKGKACFYSNNSLSILFLLLFDGFHHLFSLFSYCDILIVQLIGLNTLARLIICLGMRLFMYIFIYSIFCNNDLYLFERSI